MRPNQPLSLFIELKRRNLIRVGIAYLAGAWLLIQLVIRKAGEPGGKDQKSVIKALRSLLQLVL